ncbi:MAG TPA: ATP synthase F1 subunit epsilon [Candidatus Butyricicoccus stercorigallinarum]|nr:ATP synthase F1 subunit epsilon [Candidatus Butyricicoccus stercorigallinarum]
MRLFHLRIVTADGLYFDGEAQRVIARTIDGDVCILAGHIPYLTALGMGECRVTGSSGETRRAACIGGMLSVQGDEVNLVATTFEWAEDIDVNRAERARQRAEQLMQQRLDAREYELAQAKLKRALTRINVGK